MQLIAKTETRKAKDGRSYFVATFRPGLGQRTVNRTFWEQFKVVNGVKTDELYWERLSPEEAADAITSKEKIEGVKVTKTVEPYILGDKTVNSYSVVMFPDENVITLFASQNHPIVDQETGEILGKKVKAVISATTTETTKVTA